jgi:hypothetical protein
MTPVIAKNFTISLENPVIPSTVSEIRSIAYSTPPFTGNQDNGIRYENSFSFLQILLQNLKIKQAPTCHYKRIRTEALT